MNEEIKSYLKKENYNKVIIMLLTLLIYIFFVIDFYQIKFIKNFIVNIDVPISLIILLLSVMYVLVFRFVSKKYVKRCYFLYILFISFLLSSIIWISQSYQAYYSGAARYIYSEGNILYNTSKSILEGDYENKNELLSNIASKTNGEIIIRKNGNEFFYKPHTRDVEGYHILKISDKKLAGEKYKEEFDIEDPNMYVGFNPIISGNDIYEFEFSYANRPYWFDGILKAWTWSLSDYWRYDSKDYNKNYIRYNLQERSYNFWLPFALMLFMLTAFANIILSGYQYIKEIHAQKTYDKLLENRIMKEYYDILSSKAKATLQEYEASCLDDDKFEDNFDSKNVNISDMIHTFKNKWNSLNKTKESLIQEMLNDLRELKNVFDNKLTETDIKTVNEILTSSVPSNISRVRNLDFVLNLANTEKFDSEDILDINKYRLKSILNNLFSNANRATNNKLKDLRKTGNSQYTRKIKLSSDKFTDGDKCYYLIIMEDNGGGFADPKNIYVNPVISSDKSQGERYGEGTIYIKHFIEKIMGGKVKGENIKNTQGEICAVTKLFIPIKKRGSVND